MNEKIEIKAFPSISKEPMDDGEGCWFTPSSEGMDLRDYFACHAMQAFIVRGIIPSDGFDRKQALVSMAYETADAMMEARNDNQ
jgi:hypothetical protein